MVYILHFSEVESASIGLHRRHTVAPPSLYRHSTAATGPICSNHFLHYSIVQPQSLTPYFYKTKEYSDMSIYMGGKIRP